MIPKKSTSNRITEEKVILEENTRRIYNEYAQLISKRIAQSSPVGVDEEVFRGVSKKFPKKLAKDYPKEESKENRKTFQKDFKRNYRISSTKT